jgi:Spy/CpxP family protein refolding chaperone
MKKISAALLMSLLIVGLTTVAFGWGGGPGGCGRGPGYGPCAGGEMTMFSKLNLTTEQTEKIRDLQQTRLKEAKPLMDKMFAKRGDLKLLWLEKNPNQEKIMAAQKELRALRDQMQDKMTVYRLAVMKILTPEQQSKIQSYMGRGMGRGHGMGMNRSSGMGMGSGNCER